MSSPIPVIQTRGTPYEVGRQIGVAAGPVLRAMHRETLAEFGPRWPALLDLTGPFRDATARHLPHVLAEIRGCADGSGLPFADLFLMSIEELLYEEVRGTEADPLRLAPGERAKGCSDIAAAPPATADGHIWLAHNNDLGPGSRDQLFVTHFRVDDQPEVLAVTVGGLFISIGFNNAGLALTGNQLNANDSRSGVPRLLAVRHILAQTDLPAALDAALLPARASSYNNILSSADGRIVNVEGSASSAALGWADATGGSVGHTNHYLDPAMLTFEADPDHVPMSAARCARAFDYRTKYQGRIDRAVCERFLRDHVYAPWSVCKHAGQSVTVFSAVIDLTAGTMWLARGNPCQNPFQRYDLPRSSAHEIHSRELASYLAPAAVPSS